MIHKTFYLIGLSLNISNSPSPLFIKKASLKEGFDLILNEKKLLKN